MFEVGGEGGGGDSRLLLKRRSFDSVGVLGLGCTLRIERPVVHQTTARNGVHSAAPPRDENTVTAGKTCAFVGEEGPHDLRNGWLKGAPGPAGSFERPHDTGTTQRPRPPLNSSKTAVSPASPGWQSVSSGHVNVGLETKSAAEPSDPSATRTTRCSAPPPPPLGSPHFQGGENPPAGEAQAAGLGIPPSSRLAAPPF